VKTDVIYQHPTNPEFPSKPSLRFARNCHRDSITDDPFISSSRVIFGNLIQDSVTLHTDVQGSSCIYPCRLRYPLTPPKTRPYLHHNLVCRGCLLSSDSPLFTSSMASRRSYCVRCVNCAPSAPKGVHSCNASELCTIAIAALDPFAPQISRQIGP
jgi:hypothetical protein